MYSTSAVIASLRSESGGEAVMDLLHDAPASAAISSVNYAEVVAKLVRDGASREQVILLLEPFDGLIHPFSISQALSSGLILRQTAAYGLSLGDRACLSLAIDLGAPVWTTDRAWAELDLPIQVRLLRI